MFIQERINMLLNHLESNTPKKSPEENDRIVQAEHFISLLPTKEKVLVQDYIDYLIDSFSKDEPISLLIRFLQWHSSNEIYKHLVKCIIKAQPKPYKHPH